MNLNLFISLKDFEWYDNALILGYTWLFEYSCEKKVYQYLNFGQRKTLWKYYLDYKQKIVLPLKYHVSTKQF